MRVERGAEVMPTRLTPDLFDERLRLAGGPFVLVEYPMLRLPPVNAEFALMQLRVRGVDTGRRASRAIPESSIRRSWRPRAFATRVRICR